MASVLFACVSGCSPRRRPTPGTAGPPKAAPIATGTNLVDITPNSGIRFRWKDQPRPFTILAATGGGCGFIDYDGDGLQDVLLVATDRVALYRNLGGLRFEDVTARTGLADLRGHWMGVAVGDFNGDGRPDFLLTGYHRLALMENLGGAKFEEVTARAGLDPQNHGRWALSAGFMDLDGTGWLSLVITNYVVFGPNDDQLCETTPGVRTGCHPDHYRSEFPEIWRNRGGRFEDVTRSAFGGSAHGKSMALAFDDLSGSGRMDIYFANDTTPADLMVNQGGFRFRNAGPASGAATNEMGHPISGMGVDAADYDGDDLVDLAVTAFSDESYLMLRNRGHGLFVDEAQQAGLAGPTLSMLGFGVKWTDIDNDGWPDLLFANGHVYDNAAAANPLTTLRQRMMVFHNRPAPSGRAFVDLVPKMQGGIAREIVGRGLATADIDNDGRIDALAVDYEGAPLLLHNETAPDNNWITLDVRGRSPNRFGYGAIVRATSGGRSWRSVVSPAGSFLSSSDPRIHFGLGKAATLESITVKWQDGTTRKLTNVRANQILRVDPP